MDEKQYICKKCGNAFSYLYRGGKIQSTCDPCKKRIARKRKKRRKDYETVEQALKQSKWLLAGADPYFFDKLFYK